MILCRPFKAEFFRVVSFLAFVFGDHNASLHSPALKPWCALPASYESWWSTWWSGSQPLLPSKLRQLYDGGGEAAGSSIRAQTETARVKDGCLGRPSDDDDPRGFDGLA
jgi:hypothetical protein